MKELSEEEKEQARAWIQGTIASRMEYEYRGGEGDWWNEIKGSNHVSLSQLIQLSNDALPMMHQSKAIGELLEELYAPKYNRIYS